MKRTRRAISLFFVTVFALMMTFLFGCGGKVEGTYKFKSLSYEQGGVSINVQVGEEFMGYITLTEDFMVVTLNEDGTASIAMNAGGFYDPDWNSNGAVPHGTVIQHGKVVSDFQDANMGGGFIGFNNNNVLVLGKMTKERALSIGYRDAIEFGPYLFIIGKRSFI